MPLATTPVIAERIAGHIERLCRPGDRAPGTDRNRDATAYVGEVLGSFGLDVDELPLEVPEWRSGRAVITAGTTEIELHPGPYSPAAEGTGRLIVVHDADDLAAVDEPGGVLLLRDAIAESQLTPRNYPFYANPDHAAILDALEAASPTAVVAATGTHPPTCNAMSPFPLIEEVEFAAPHAYTSVDNGQRLTTNAGEIVSITIDSEVRPSTGTQPIARLQGSDAGRIVVCAHVDTKPGTPGALDNASGVAVLLAVAELLAATALPAPFPTIELVPFNGEDHVQAPGEIAYLAATGDPGDVALVVNIDSPGLPGGPSTYSTYGVDEPTRRLLARLAADDPGIDTGPAWFAGDHMVFAMREVPALALISADLAAVTTRYAHTPADTPDLLDPELLAATARFITRVLTTWRPTAQDAP
jgi:aminopeptidase YwaD